mmetsp:Transcript_47614/g.153071  ORF Transcript_47614/g.153071 Transcript_47614/m.153071 type:complete len:222 (-) Transcript_47614:652-1317(-)
MVNLPRASWSHFLEKHRRLSHESKISPRNAQAPRSRSSMLSKMRPKRVLGICPTKPMASGPAPGPKPCDAIASTKHAKASRARLEMALRRAGAASAGIASGDSSSLRLFNTSSFLVGPDRTAPRAARATWPCIDLGSKAGSRVPRTMEAMAALNSSQPAHSTKPHPRASSERTSIPGGVSLTTCHTWCATSKSCPPSPTALPKSGRGRNLAPSSASMMPKP